MPKGVKGKKLPADPIVVLNEKYQVKLSSTCMVLQKKTSQEEIDKMQDLTKEEKAEGYVVLGYFSNWDYLGTILLRDMQRDKAAKAQTISIQEYLDNLNKSRLEIEEMFKSIDTKSRVSSK